MAKNKTTYTNNSVTEFVSNIESEVRRTDSFTLIEIFKSITGYEPKMYGPTIIGFGNYHYRYASGHEGDAPLAAFSPRKDALVIYVSSEFEDKEILFEQLGKYKYSNVCCVYIKKLSDIDIKVLKKIIKNSMTHTMKLYPSESGHNCKC